MDNIYVSIIYLVIGLIIGGIIGFFLARHYFQKQMKENPPINEKMIRAMYAQMGSIMKSMKQ